MLPFLSGIAVLMAVFMITSGRPPAVQEVYAQSICNVTCSPGGGCPCSGWSCVQSQGQSWGCVQGGGGTCGNGQINSGETCDPGGPGSFAWCGSSTPCPSSCICPTTVDCSQHESGYICDGSGWQKGSCPNGGCDNCPAGCVEDPNDNVLELAMCDANNEGSQTSVDCIPAGTGASSASAAASSSSSSDDPPECDPGEVCRAAAGACDAAEICTAQGECPANDFIDAGQVCRAANGACDVAETCNGNAAACPADGFAAANVECRASAGVCDVAEKCGGNAAACPADAFVAAGQVCRGAAAACDAIERCNGNAAACPANLPSAAGVVCRPEANTCDIAEKCDGNAMTCPIDKVKPPELTAPDRTNKVLEGVGGAIGAVQCGKAPFTFTAAGYPGPTSGFEQYQIQVASSGEVSGNMPVGAANGGQSAWAWLWAQVGGGNGGPNPNGTPLTASASLA